MIAHDTCVKKSFQFFHDNAASGDHTQKFSKFIKATNTNGNIFTASRTTLSLIGKVTTNHLTFAKSNP